LGNSNKKVLVTGASGFVGSWLTQKLLDLGHNVFVLSRSGTASIANGSIQPHVLRGDINDLPSLQKNFAGMDAIFHLAGVVGYSRAMRHEMNQTNVVGTANVISAVEKCGCDKLIHMSSVVAVGASFDGSHPLNEESPYNLHHLNLGYFETKRQAEELVMEACRQDRIQATIINPSTIYGPGDAKKGSRSVQVKVARGDFPFYPSGGVNVIHIQDVVDAAVRAWEVGRQGERYILSGENIRIQKLFQLIAAAANVPAPRWPLPKYLTLSIGHIGDLLEKINVRGPLNSENAWAAVLFHWFDNAKARRELGLNPRPAASAITESVHWMRDNGVLQ
jgi:dihydroflavonol-4-reductase